MDNENGLRQKRVSRKQFIKTVLKGAVLFILGGVFFGRASRMLTRGGQVWQIDPEKCVKCGRCATACVLAPSAVKCVHQYDMCGYCDLCFGYFQPGARKLTEAAENQLCPTHAIKRNFIEEPYFEYTIDESLCIGCGKCVKGCNLFGNGSLYLQVRHDRCKNCNECSIAMVCPGEAFIRVPASKGYAKRI